MKSVLRYRRAYDSANILSGGKPVIGGVDLARAPVIAGAVADMERLVGVRPDCVHLTTREGGQIHTSHSDKMGFDVRGTVHLGADVLLNGQVDPAKSTDNFVLSSGGLPQPLRLPMRSRDAYISTDQVLHIPFRHGIMPPDQASLSIVSTFSPGRVFHVLKSKSHPLAVTFPSLCGVPAVDGEDAFESRLGTLFRRGRSQLVFERRETSPPAARCSEQASAYHQLGRNGDKKKKAPGGEKSIKKRKEDSDTFKDDCSKGGAAASGKDQN